MLGKAALGVVLTLLWVIIVLDSFQTPFAIPHGEIRSKGGRALLMPFHGGG